MDHAALYKRGSVHVSSEGHLFNVLPLVLLKISSKVKLCSTHVWFLPVMCSVVLSQLQNVSQDQATYFTGVGTLGQ